MIGLFFTLGLWAAQPSSHNASGCSAAIQNIRTERQIANQNNIRSLYEALANAPDDQVLQFNFSRSIQIICPFKNLCGIGSSSVKMEFSEWLQIMSKNQVGQQLQIQVTTESLSVTLKKDSQHPLKIPNLVEVGEDIYVPEPLSSLYLELKEPSQQQSEDSDVEE